MNTRYHVHYMATIRQSVYLYMQTTIQSAVKTNQWSVKLFQCSGKGMLAGQPCVM